jgi:hypothetical protein
MLINACAHIYLSLLDIMPFDLEYLQYGTWLSLFVNFKKLIGLSDVSILSES